VHQAELWFGGPLWERFPYGAIFNRLRVSKTFEPGRFYRSHGASHILQRSAVLFAPLASVILYVLVHQPGIKELAKARVRKLKRLLFKQHLLFP